MAWTSRPRTWTLRIAVAGAVLLAGCSNANTQLQADVTVAGVTSVQPSAPPTTAAPTTSAASTSAPSTAAPASERDVTAEVELPSIEPTGLEFPLLLFSDSIKLVQPDGSVSLLERDEAVRVAGDTLGGVIFQRKLDPGAQSSILWQAAGAIVPQAIFIPEPNQRVELHGVTTVTGAPEVVFSVTSPDSTNRSLNRIDPFTGIVTELTVVDDAEFGSKATQVDGLFIVTTWERPEASGWTVYQSGTGRAIGGSFPDVEAGCADGNGRNCARLASLSLDIKSVFRIVPHDEESVPGRYDLLVTLSENGSEVTRVDLTELEGIWYPEHLAELPDGRLLLSRSVDPEQVRPTNGVVIDPDSGAVTVLGEVGFVRLP